MLAGDANYGLELAGMPAHFFKKRTQFYALRPGSEDEKDFLRQNRFMCDLLLMPVCDAAFGQIVRREFHGDAVTG